MILNDKFTLPAINDMFKNPSSEYRGMPFWAWNTSLDEAELLRQIDVFKKMGFGGFFMHSRGGMATEYLGEKFMAAVRSCVEYAEKNELNANLYDEDRWPSGFAGGYVTEDKACRMKRLCFSQKPYEQMMASEFGKNECDPRLLSIFDIIFDECDRLNTYKIIDEDVAADGEKWYVYIINMPCCGYHNGYTYSDTLNPAVIDKFIRITHDAYKDKVGDKFGKTVNMIFTDEPNYGRIFPKTFARDGKDVLLPWTNNLLGIYIKQFGGDLTEKLPELVWNLKNDAPSVARYRYYKVICELLASSYGDKIGAWCDRNGISLTGHMLDEATIESQICAVGEVMRNMQSFTLPGVDMLCNDVEFTTVKQAQSVAHQCGRRGVTSELYGVTGWDFDFRGHKFQGDWQAALGVTQRVPHLAHLSLCGAGKRDYPASINYQSSWVAEYGYIENHFARLNVALTRGKPVVNIAVIHPVESGFLLNGVKEHNSEAMSALNKKFKNITEWLLRGHIDFDFVSESMLPDMYSVDEGNFTVGEMKYKAVFVPPLSTIRSSTVKALAELIENGGNVFVSGECPTCVDGEICDSAKELWVRAKNVMFYEPDVIRAFDDLREIDICGSNGLRRRDLIYGMRGDGDKRWLFIAQCDMPSRNDGEDCIADTVRITVNGLFKPTLYDTVNGKIIKDINYLHKNGNTEITIEIYSFDSLLFLLEPSSEEKPIAQNRVACDIGVPVSVPDFVEYVLSEPNVLVLDIAKWSRDGAKYNQREEILRIDSAVRKELGYPLANCEDVQPWKCPPVPPREFVYLKFDILSDIETIGNLCFEHAESVTFNGKKIALTANGNYVDRGIISIALGKIERGMNELIVKMPISERVSLENMFITGKFGVDAIGSNTCIVKSVSQMAFGSICKQGLPFYGSNIAYKIPFETVKNGTLTVKTDYYIGAAVGVKLDGVDIGKIVIPPYTAEIPDVKSGKHLLELTLFGTRANTFGALHLTAPLHWKGPNMWYTRDNLWSYEYCLSELGVMKKPELFIR